MIALDRGGRALSSKAWASWLSERRIDAQDLCFLIGGPEGLSAADHGPRRRAHLARARRPWPTSSPGSSCSSSSSAPRRSSPASRTTSSYDRRLESDGRSGRRAPLRRRGGRLGAARRRRRRRSARRRSSARRSPSSATTRPTRRCCSRRRSASSRAERPRSSRRSSAGASRGASRRSRSPGPASSTSSCRTTGTGAAAEELAAQGERLGRPPGADEAKERINVEFVSANPTGPMTAAGGPRRRTRRLDRAGPRVRRPLGRRASTTSTTAEGRSTASRASIARADEGRAACPRTATRATTSPSCAASLEQEGLDPGRSRRRRAPRHRADGGARPRRRCAATASSSTPGPRSAPCTSRARSSGPSTEAREAGHVYESEGATWLRTTELRRRQGPRPDPLGRRADLLRSPTSPTTATSSSAAPTG